MRLSEGFEKSLTDWARLDALTDEEIAAAIQSDPDSFEPETGSLEHALVVRASRPKQRLTIRLDADLVEWFKAQGPATGRASTPSSAPMSNVRANRRPEPPIWLGGHPLVRRHFIRPWNRLYCDGFGPEEAAYA
jgi:uncharacterized protein (DUF4415 family)